MMCNEQGGVVDDLLVYRLGERRFMLVVNAGTQNSDETWIRRHLSAGTVFENISGQTAKIDVQGPAAPQAMQRLMDEDIAGMRYYTFGYNRYGAKRVLISRTGYTGEIGFEVYGEADLLRRLWDACLDIGAVPACLGARDTLRLEAGLPLYGHELCPGRNAAESGFTKAIAEDKEFVGSEAIRNPAPGRAALVGIALDGRRAARAGDPVYDAEGRQAGIITSGSFAPCLGHAVALGYVKEACRLPGYRIVVRTEKQTLAGQVTSTPFYRGTARKPVGQFLDRATERRPHMTPEDRHYLRSHEWVKVVDDLAVVGISDYAQGELGDITFVELPEPGHEVEQLHECAVIESVKAASDLYAPVTGEIAECNDKLHQRPELINEDPYGEGWIFKIKDFDPATLDILLTAAEYDHFTEESM